jgi:hypothetical protein
LAFAGEIDLEGLSRRQLAKLERLNHNSFLVVAEATAEADGCRDD